MVFSLLKKIFNELSVETKLQSSLLAVREVNNKIIKKILFTEVIALVLLFDEHLHQ
ncbi:MAG: hypothetical protein RIR21_2370, partial [Pseudomonadota bacterium]